MAAKGQFKPPIDPLNAAFSKALMLLDSYPCGCAIFMVGGRVCAAPRASKRVAVLANNLIGVYDDGFDARRLRDDISTFYRESA